MLMTTLMSLTQYSCMCHCKTSTYERMLTLVSCKEDAATSIWMLKRETHVTYLAVVNQNKLCQNRNKSILNDWNFDRNWHFGWKTLPLKPWNTWKTTKTWDFWDSNKKPTSLSGQATTVDCSLYVRSLGSINPDTMVGILGIIIIASTTENWAHSIAYH